MVMCDVCGNNSDQPIEIKRREKTGVFDSFECAIHAIAPVCGHCGCKIIGHPTYALGTSFCCDHCVEHGMEGQPTTISEYDPVYPG